MTPVDPLQRLGGAVADEQNRRLADGAALAGARARLLGAPAPGRRRGRAAAVAGLAGLAAAAAAALLVARGRPGGLGFSVAGQPGQADSWLAAPASGALPLRFDDGTAIDLLPSARARVASVSPQGARVILERGGAEVAVVHRPGARWLVDAGPFEIRVTGTRFAVEWDASLEVFRLTMAEGSVEVKSPCLSSPLRFVAGQSIALGCPARPAASASPGAAGAPASATPGPSAPAPTASSAALVPGASGAPGLSGTSGHAGAPGAASGRPSEAPAASASGAAGAPAVPASAASAAAEGPGWKELAAGRRYREALAAAEAAGFDGLCSSEDAGGLVQLGDVARFAGNTGRAVQALTALRRRFAGDGRASAAAFTLGRIAFDQRGAFGEAAGWFSTYLSEQPGGGLAQEALGRLMEARQRSGDAAGARHAAQQYLARFPGGGHEALARKLLPEAAP